LQAYGIGLAEARGIYAKGNYIGIEGRGRIGGYFGGSEKGLQVIEGGAFVTGGLLVDQGGLKVDNYTNTMSIDAKMQGTPGWTGDLDTYQGIAVKGDNTANGWGIYGRSRSSTGVVARSNSGFGAHGLSDSNTGVQAESNTGFGLYARSNTNHAIWGETNNGSGVTGKSKTGVGVYGESRDSIGVWGRAFNNTGVYGQSDTGWAVYGRSNTNLGVYGESTTGWGVHARSRDNTAMYGVSSNGWGVHGRSETGGLGVRAESNSGWGLWATTNNNTAVFAESYGSGWAIHAKGAGRAGAFEYSGPEAWTNVMGTGNNGIDGLWWNIPIKIKPYVVLAEQTQAIWSNGNVTFTNNIPENCAWEMNSADIMMCPGGKFATGLYAKSGVFKLLCCNL
jgi:hypothetical protein